MIRLFSKRYSAARGWYWEGERIINDEARAQEWLELFRNDEPNVTFVLSKNEPRFFHPGEDL